MNNLLLRSKVRAGSCPFAKTNGAVRRCPSVFAAGRNIRRNGARNGINGHGLKQNLARSRHNGVEKAFSAEEHIFDSADGLNIHCAGRTHCGKIAGVYNDGLPGGGRIQPHGRQFL